MKEDKCPQDSSSSKDREDHGCPNRAIDLLSDIRKYLEVPENRRLSKGNVELGLEIEINESLKHVLTSQNSDSDDLLDVTIIRPSDSDIAHETTVALNKDEVRDFISLVEQHHKNKLKSTKRKHKDSAASKQKIKETKTQTTKHTKDTQQETDKVKSKHEKPGTPCVCQHCGVMGVLVQKSPIVDYPVLEDRRPLKDDKKSSSKKREKSHERTKESNRSNSGGSTNSMDQVQLLREINARIKNLEKRLTVQEETAVPREYLKHVLHKILTQYKSKQDCQIKKEHKTKSIATQYVAEIREPKCFDYRKKSPYDVHNVFDHSMANPLLHKTNTTPLPSKSCISDSVSSNTIDLQPQKSETPVQKDLFWFWGEEIVKPGCDLKTKILSLLEDKMHPTIPSADADRENDKTPEKLPKSDNMTDIRVERDDKLLMLGKMNEIPPCNIDDYVLRSKPPSIGSKPTKLPVMNSRPSSPVAPTKSTTRPSTPPSKNNPYSQKAKEYGVINTLPSTNTHYPFDPKRTLDDSTFKKNIEAQKEKLKEKQVSKQFNYKNLTPADTNTMTTALQRMNNQFRSTKGTDDAKYPVFQKTPMPTIRHNMNKGFRTKKFEPPVKDLTLPVDVTYISPKVTHWSEESTASEDKYMKMKAGERNERPPIETKESLIYKLEFLKNLAKHKSADQSKVLNKIWNQAKKTAKSKNDAVFIKIPFKSINTIEPRHNVIEMQLTLEQLETVVKSVKETNASSTKIGTLKSTSDIDLGQRRHEEIKRANAAILNKRRQMSAKANKSKK